MANPSIWTPGEAISANDSRKHQWFTAAAGQTEFTLTNFTYEIGTGSLAITVSGVEQRPGVDFTETSSNSFTLTSPIEVVGTVVLAEAFVEVTGSPVTITDISTITYDGGLAVDVLDTVKPFADYAALRAYNGRATRCNIIAEGISGPFTVDADDTTSADNGGTVLVDASGRRWRRDYSGAVNIKWFGAKGDGTTDDTAAIQAAVSSLPTNTASVGVFSPKGFANGGGVLVPRGRYKVSAAINLYRGIHLSGESRESSQIISFTSGSVLLYEDAGGYIQDEIVIENLSVWQDSSVVAASGAGINLNIGPYVADSIQVRISNVIVEGTYDGILIAAAGASKVEGSNISRCVRHGVNFYGTDVANTSLTAYNTYCHLNGGSGFQSNIASYISFVGCAADSNTQYGYSLTGVNGYSIHACGAEQNALGAAYIKDTLSGTVQIHMVVQAGAVNGITLNNASGTTLVGCDFISDALNTGYAVRFEASARPITVLGPYFAGGFATNKFSSPDQALVFGGNSSLFKGGDTNIWTLGAAASKDTTTQLSVAGTAESTVSIGTKSAVTFSEPNATRNTALQSQAITANTAKTYALLIGHYIAAAFKGAASTVTRLAGVYIAQQTAGSTANANLVIDAGAGIIPAGNWNIYSDSTRDNYFKGPMTWKPSASATPTNNGDVTFELTSDTSLKIKVRGSDGTVRSVTLTLA